MSSFANDLLAGLSQSPKHISPKYFYDLNGSKLFDQICDLPEYYPTRTEWALLQNNASAIAKCLGSGIDLIEFGAGSLRKVALLLDALIANHLPPKSYVPIDISAEHLEASCKKLQVQYPELNVTPRVLDYSEDMTLPTQVMQSAHPKVGFFPGSSLGNFNHDQALSFLSRAAKALSGGGLLLGVDLVKDPQVLHAAYNDSQGITAAFNLNVLARANRELGANFDLTAFDHYAFYQPREARIEMHLQSKRAQTVNVLGHEFEFAQGESLHTENSYKFTLDSLHRLALKAGFQIGEYWLDEREWFCMQWLIAP